MNKLYNPSIKEYSMAGYEEGRGLQELIPDPQIDPEATIGNVGRIVHSEAVDLPLDSVPVVISNIGEAIAALEREKRRQGANVSALNARIQLLQAAMHEVDQAAGGMIEAQREAGLWLGAAVIDFAVV